MIWSYLRQLHNDVRARIDRYVRTQEVIKVFSTQHQLELAAAPPAQWAMVKSQQAAQIQAVRDGKFDIIDRRSWAYPYLPEALHRLNQPILKNTPYNLRRFSETPIPRRATNLIKNALKELKWEIEAMPDVEDDSKAAKADREKRIKILSECFRRPNNTDSFQTLIEAVAEDNIIGGYGCIEPRLTPSYKRPLKMWPVDGSTIRIYADWTESTPDRPRFAQMTGLKGERGIVPFLSDELVYIRDNVRSNTPFGLGKGEVAFNSVNAFLGVQDMSAKAGSDQVHKTMLWWESPQNQAHVQTIRRHVQNEIEGQAKISLVSGMKKPETIDIQAVLPEDLLLEWQEFLIRIIANAYDLSPFSLGLEKDVNRNTGLIMALSDFRGAVVPTAVRIEEALTRDIIHGFLGWKDLRFVYKGLDDPDPLTKVQIQQRRYQMNSLTPDEIRANDGQAPLEGGWGRLTLGQMQILIQEAMAMARAKLGGGAAGGGGYGAGAAGGASIMPGAGSYTGGMGTGSGMGTAGGGATGGGMRLIGSAEFSAEDVAQMSPEEVQYFQEMGMLPDSSDLANQLEQAGVLEQLTEELKEFFDKQEETAKDDEEKPAKVTAKDEREQQKKFKKSMHTPTVVEQYLNDRYRYWQPRGEMQPRVRGKYPRSGGRKGTYT